MMKRFADRGEAGRAAGSVGVVAATLVVVACTWVLRAPSAPPVSALTATDAAAPFRAVVVFQLADCETALPWLRVFDEAGIRERVAMTGLVVGRDADVERAAMRLEDVFRRVPVAAAGRRGASALWPLGYRATPYVVILDGAGRVRYTSPAPDRLEIDVFRATLRGVVGAP